MVGPVFCTGESGDKISCNYVSVEEAGSQKLGKHHFCIISEVKDTGIKDMLNKITKISLKQYNRESLIRC